MQSGMQPACIRSVTGALYSTVMCWCVVCYRAQMQKVMVTVLRHNAAAHEFFLNKLKYVLLQ